MLNSLDKALNTLREYAIKEPDLNKLRDFTIEIDKILDVLDGRVEASEAAKTRRTSAASG
jgi:hypothetical protein